MKLFRYDNFQIVISEEALTLKPFRELWEKDRSKDKINAKNEFAFIYFVYDPRSEYQFIVDETERKIEVRKGLGLSDKWCESDLLRKAIELYKILTQTTTSLALEDTRISLEKIRSFIKDYDIKESEDPIKSAKEILSIGKMIPDYVKKIVEMEKLVAKEIEEQGRMRGGSQNKKLFEDGFSF